MLAYANVTLVYGEALALGVGLERLRSGQPQLVAQRQVPRGDLLLDVLRQQLYQLVVRLRQAPPFAERLLPAAHRAASVSSSWGSEARRFQPSPSKANQSLGIVAELGRAAQLAVGPAARPQRAQRR